MEPQIPPDESEQPRKSRSVLGTLRDDVFSITDWIDTAWQKIGNLTDTNFRLAIDLAAKGRVDDAILRLKITLWLAPDHVPSMYNLGCLHLHKVQSQEALHYFARVLKRQPAHELALYMVATINPSLLKPEVKPHFVPPEIVIDQFNAQAVRYEAEQRQRQYQLPAMMYQLLSAEMGSAATRHDLLDLGCGTGLCGSLFLESFTNIVGVDVANNMLDIAYRKLDRRGMKIYTRLVHQDLRFFLNEAKENTVDLALCVSVFPYLGNLESTFAGVAKVLRPGGYFVCSFTPYQQPGTYGVLPATGYFGHDLNHVLSLAQQTGLDSVRTGEVLAYPQTHAQLCFFRKPAV